MRELLHQISEISDHLHRELSMGASRGNAWLLLDPSPLVSKPREDEWLNGVLADSVASRVHSSRAEIPAEMYAKFLPVNSNNFHGSQQLLNSIEAALTEIKADELNLGNGRVVAGWFECGVDSDSDAQRLISHYLRFMFHRRVDNRIEWLRWYDPAVLWILWDVLNAVQRKTLLGPITRLWILDPVGQLVNLQCTDDVLLTGQVGQSNLNPLNLSVEQWQQIDNIGPFNRALLKTQLGDQNDGLIKGLTPSALAQHRRAGFGALSRARQHGIKDPQDLALFAELAMQCHPKFDQHSLVITALQRFHSDVYFSACVADIDDAQWRVIASEMSASHSD